uniref:Copper homeostasis protein cutC homolog n=1 Tax=Aureoumbra lagunensis TaxID=44058 RepID=A0A7S3JYA0_9STRA|mmetsp:Transcript_12213/g.16505  ORF Transcript_12213/g.16505 Transcript_12213/m.16505 type:complete len:353 (+) Transcript_12213:68-1126(+)
MMVADSPSIEEVRETNDDESWREKPERLVYAAPSLVQSTRISTEIFLRCEERRIRLRVDAESKYAPVYQIPGFEVCVAIECASAALRAIEGGAKRLELYTNSAGEIRATAALLRQYKNPAELYVHLNGGDSLNEIAKMALRVDLAFAKSLGARGVILGALEAKTHHLDADFLEQLVKIAKPMKVAFSAQAFEALLEANGQYSTLDQRSRRLSALDSLIDLGVTTIYIQDLHALQDTIDLARGRISIVAALRGNDGYFLSSDFTSSLLRGIRKLDHSSSTYAHHLSPNFFIQLFCPPPSESPSSSSITLPLPPPSSSAPTGKRRKRTSSPSSTLPHHNNLWPPTPPPLSSFAI